MILFATIQKSRFKKSKWIEPYTETPNGKLRTTIIDCYSCGQAGVYLIRHKQSKTVVYVGSSTGQLKKTIYRHFQQWTDRQRKGGEQFERKTYPKTGFYEIRFIKCTANQALHMEKYLIRKLQPKDNPIKYNQLTLQEAERGQALYEEAIEAPTLPNSAYLEEAPF